MTVRVEQRGGVRVLTLEGEMTIYRASELKEALLDPPMNCDELELDLSAVSELDSAGLQILLLLKREAESARRRLRLVNHSRAVYEVLELLDMQGHFGDPVVIPVDWGRP
jgi:anti-sigma B factor antagonist